MCSSLFRSFLYLTILIVLSPVISGAQESATKTLPARQTAMRDTGKNGVERMPEFPGDANIYVARQSRYPRMALDSNWQGQVIVSFVVDENGDVKQIGVATSSGHELLDREAVRIITEMPKWQPGKDKGVPVAVGLSMPINFSLSAQPVDRASPERW